MFRLFAFLIFMLCGSTLLLAAEWSDLWLTKNQQAKKAFDAGNYAEAIELFEDPSWKASAQYQAGNYSASAQTYLKANNNNDLYNYANSLVKMGQLTEAIEAYSTVIQNESSAKDAIFNRNLIQELLDQQQDDKNESQSDQSSEDDKDGEKSNEKGEGESETSQQSDSQSDEQEHSESVTQDEMDQKDLEAIERELEKASKEQAENKENEEISEQTNTIEARADQEDQQAMEQWLRRISDDPGGLLRRKFRYQYQRQGFDQDGNQLWPDDGVQPW